MSSMSVLVVENDSEEFSRIRESLRNEGFILSNANGAAEALEQLAAREFEIVLLSMDIAEKELAGLVSAMREVRRDMPLQVIRLARVRAPGDAHGSIESGADDFMKKPFDVLELQARTRAAEIRWQRQATLLKEREFYRIAVAEEERLSSLVLDQNQSLKDAYEKIRRLNDELERANKELEQIAAYDSLSGLLNRRSLFTRISIEIERSIRLEVPLTGLMIDLDRFKVINDSYGHQCGDMVIREIGARLLGGLRKYDYAGRYGGEEFFIVLSNSTEEQALGIAERFRHDMEDASLSCNGEDFTLTVSVGAARYRPGESQEAWIERADRAMYQAKQAGRNRIAVG